MSHMKFKHATAFVLALLVLVGIARLATNCAPAADPEGKRPNPSLNLNPPAISTDKSVKYDYPIVKVAPLTPEDRLTLIRWIALGCSIDLDYNPAKPKQRGFGWMQDDNRPTLTLTYSKPGMNGPLTRILVGMH